MAKYIVFKPCDLNDDEEPSSSILWKAKFSIGEKFQELIPESIFTLIDQKDKQISNKQGDRRGRAITREDFF